MRRHLLLATLLLGSIAACDLSPAEPQGSKVTVNGTVTWGGQPVDSARVFVMALPPVGTPCGFGLCFTWLGPVYSDVRGRYALSGKLPEESWCSRATVTIQLLLPDTTRSVDYPLSSCAPQTTNHDFTK